MSRRWEKVGIIAGGGDLPRKLADACVAMDAPFHVLRLNGFADEEMKAYPGDDCGLGEAGKIIRLLKKSECDAVVFAGLVQRPNFTKLKPDWRGAALLPRVVAAARKGDGAMLDVLVETFAAEGFLVIGAEEVTGALRAGQGPLGQYTPDDASIEDMAKAAALIEAIGPFDVGQGAVVRDGFVVAVEAAEGTDAMLRRCAPIIARLQGEGEGEARRAGVLLKRPKPGQELRIDLPTIGVRTVELAVEAGLAGIAVAAEASLVLDSEETVELANESGLFIYAYTSEELKRRS
ncbi:MAG: UDP-2,3-diacylglucosamine diphosphatase LpxI [Pseudomonadota bacterium]